MSTLSLSRRAGIGSGSPFGSSAPPLSSVTRRLPAVSERGLYPETFVARKTSFRSAGFFAIQLPTICSVAPGRHAGSL